VAHGGRAAAITIAAVAISLSGAVPVNAADTAACDLTGQLSVSPAVHGIGVAFDGLTVNCGSGGTAALTGSFSCATRSGTGFVTFVIDDSASYAQVAVTAADDGVAAIGTIASGPYAGRTVATSLTSASAVNACATGRSTRSRCSARSPSTPIRSSRRTPAAS
jgi:hypothetical protein